MVDLSKAKAGDKAKLRCGGEVEISHINNNHEFYFNYQQWGNGIKYMSDGRIARKDNKNLYENEKHAFDIVSIEPAPFDWSTVKAGMAFKHTCKTAERRWDNIVYYCCPSTDKGWVLMTLDDRLQGVVDSFSIFEKSDLVRVPERDVEASHE